MFKLSNTQFSKEAATSLAILAFLFLYMLALNFLMPLHRDDYEYALIWGTYEKITTWPDILQSLSNHYFTHGGRMTDFFVLDSFLLLGKQWFNPFNALLFVALIVLIYWHSQRSLTLRFSPYILVLITLFCWVSLPQFAQVNIWMTGACVYLFTEVLILAFLLPYHSNFWGNTLFKDKFPAILGMFFGGILAGWTIENTAATMNFIIAGFIFYAYKNQHIDKWMLSGFLGSLTGFILLVISPGNLIRAASINTKPIYHFSNLLAATGELMLYVLPIIFFLVLVWRLLLKDYVQHQGFPIVTAPKAKLRFSISIVLIPAFILFLIVSYFNGSFFSVWLANLIYNNVAIPLGFTTKHLKEQFFHTMSGLEEMAAYLLTITLIYKAILKKLALQKSNIKKIQNNIEWRKVMDAYPNSYFAVALLTLAAINNLVMLASPSFPGRAGYGAAVFMIISAASCFTIPQISSFLLASSRKRYMAIIAGIIFFPMAAAVLHQHLLLYKENTARMSYVEHMINNNAEYLELEPLALRNFILRHVYFVELNNHVSKYGFCRYYRLKDIHVKD